MSDKNLFTNLPIDEFDFLLVLEPDPQDFTMAIYGESFLEPSERTEKVNQRARFFENVEATNQKLARELEDGTYIDIAFDKPGKFMASFIENDEDMDNIEEDEILSILNTDLEEAEIDHDATIILWARYDGQMDESLFPVITNQASVEFYYDFETVAKNLVVFFEGVVLKNQGKQIRVAIIGIPLLEDVMGMANLLNNIPGLEVSIIQRYCLNSDGLSSFNDAAMEIGIRNEAMVNDEIEFKYQFAIDALEIPEVFQGEDLGLSFGLEECDFLVLVETTLAPSKNINKWFKAINKNINNKKSGMGISFILFNPFSSNRTIDSSFDDDNKQLFELYFNNDIEIIAKQLGNYMTGISKINGRPARVGLVGDLVNSDTLLGFLTKFNTINVKILKEYCVSFEKNNRIRYPAA